MGKGTAAQLELAERLPNPRIGACRMPHCKTLQPAKNMYGGMCYFHMRMVVYWAKKTGYDMKGEAERTILARIKKAWGLLPPEVPTGPERVIEAYCEWLCQEAKRRYGIQQLPNPQPGQPIRSGDKPFPLSGFVQETE